MEADQMSFVTRVWPLMPAFVVALGAFIVAIGGFWAAYRQSSFNAELRQKNAEIARLQEENTNAVIGGDSFCRMALQVGGPNGETVNASRMPDDLLLVPLFIHGGKYPLYDVSARIVDLDILRKDAVRATTIVSVGNMTPGFSVSNNVRMPHHGKDFNFNIFYIGRNGSWTQKLRMRWIENGWATATVVVRGFGGDEIYKEISARYPLDERGNVVWDEKPIEVPASKAQE